MTKLLKILGNTILILVEITLLIVISFVFLIRTSSFQTYLAKQGADFLSKKLDTEVRIGKVDITFLDRVYFDELYIEDQKKDTLAYIQEFFVNFNLAGISSLRFNVDEIGVNRAHFALRKYKGEEEYNMQFIIDSFVKDTSSSDPVDFQLNVKKINIRESHFILDNEEYETQDFGVDFMHLNGRDIDLKAENVVITPENYQADIKNLAFKEQSGFEITSFLSKAQFNDSGLDLRATDIETKYSHLKLDSFLLKSQSLEDFSDFVNKVHMESYFDTSQVSLKEVSYFAPQLKGMNEIVTLNGSTHNVISDFQMRNIYLQMGVNTRLKGDFSLPDFIDMKNAKLDQELDYLHISKSDIEQLKLPENSEITYIEWPEALGELNRISLTNLKAKGRVHDFKISLNQIQTNIGSLVVKDPFNLSSDTSFTTINITPLANSKEQIKLENINLGQVLNSSDYGMLNGYIGLRNAKIINGNFHVNGVEGLLEQTHLFDYNYDYIVLDNINYSLNANKAVTENYVKGNIYVRDDNFDMSFQGLARLGSELDIKAELNLECARLEQINPAFEGRGELNSSIYLDVTGKNFNDFVGTLLIDSLYYEEGDQFFTTSDFYAFMERAEQKDSISIKSDIVGAELNGRIDYNNVAKNISYQISQIIPLLDPDSKMDVNDELTHFEYDIEVKQMNKLLDIFYPSLQIANNATIDGYYDGKKNNLGLNINADYVKFDSIKMNNINALQEVSNQELLALLDISTITINDSLAFQKVHFTGLAAQGNIDSQLLFEGPLENNSNLEWFTQIDSTGFFIDISPSYININEHVWNLHNTASVIYADSCFSIDGLKFEHEEQYISANGNLSNSTDDRLYVDVMDLNLKEFGNVLGPDVEFSGIMNLAGYITTPISNFQFFGESIIEELYINETEVGNVSFGANYQSEDDKIAVFGDILYSQKQTFAFEGDYLVEKDEEIGNLDLDMKFRSTDIGVVSEFLDPDVIQSLEGNLNGDLQLTGTFEEPKLTGKVDFNDGMVNIALLGANMYFDGEIESVKDGLYINQMPIRDEEGNTGFIDGTLFHDNFSDFIFEIIVNLEEHPVKRMPNDRSRALPVDRFKIMSTEYDIESLYYGEGYVTGVANISGQADNLSIIVNAKTQRGTRIVLPMYGPTTIEEDGFISFKSAGQLEEVEKRVDLTGVDLQLNFDVTEDAVAKLIFDEKIGDEISARGNGKISLSVDQFNDLAMDGTYTVASGVYNFALGPYKQNFSIEPGGSVQWTGDPLEAILDINAYYKTTANLSVVMPSVVEDQASNNEEIYSYLTIKGSMMSPEISFDIEAPKASESGKAVIARIRSDQDELNKQFFSILISKSFMPLSGGGNAAGGTSGAFLDLASTQINALLGKISEDYQMNVNLESDEYSGQFSGEFGVTKGFLDDRLLVSGSFGVGTQVSGSAQANSANQNQLIGDVKVEYLLNEKGSFRMNVFNESNNNTVLQNEDRGQFTQGVGVSYKEDFHTLEDFKLFQFFANIFRKRENWVNLQESRDKRVPIPEKYRKENAIKNEE